MLIPFAKFMPDQPDHKSGSSQYILNCIPRGGYFSPFNNISTFTDAITARCQGAFSAQNSDGITKLFVGDATKLYLLGTAGAWEDVSSTTYALASDEHWSFAQYGTRVIATHISNAPQSYVMGSSTDFAALGGSPPQARHIAVIRDIVVLGNTTTSPSQVQWSDIDGPATWSGGVADSQTLPTGGWVQGIVGGQNGLVFMESSIYRMLYGGDANIVFQFDEVERNRGLYVPTSLANVGSRVFYLSADGFYMCSTGGGDSLPIGAKRVDRWFFDHAEEGDLNRMSVGIDPNNKLVLWSFRSTDAVGANPDKILIYNWDVDEWGLVEMNLEWLFACRAPGYTLEDLDAISSSLDGLAFSLDSRVWTGGSFALAGAYTDHKVGFFTGSALEARIETMESDIFDGRRGMVTAVKPIGDTTSAAVKVGTKERAGDAVSYGTEATQRTSGDCPVRASGRYLRGRVRIPAATTWTQAQGIEVTAHDDGER